MLRMLDDELIRDIEQRWRERSPGLLDRLRPGLDDVEIDRISTPLGFDLPEEVRRWYRWNNGAIGAPIIFSRCFEKLSDDVRQTLDLQQDDEKWPIGWLKVMDEQPYLIFDCRGAADQPVPVWHYGYSFDWDRPTRPVFDSIGDMVAFWIELTERGQVVFDPSAGWNALDSLPNEISQRIRGVPTD